MAARILLSYTAARGLKLALPCPMEDRRIAAETLLVTLDDRTLDRVIAPPDVPGAAPRGAVDSQDYRGPRGVVGLRGPAWGWVEYDRPLSPGQVKAYGLRVIKDL